MMIGDVTLDAGITRIELEDIVVDAENVIARMCVARVWCRIESMASLPYIPPEIQLKTRTMKRRPQTSIGYNTDRLR